MSYEDIGRGFTGCFIVLLILAIPGFLAICWGLWWLFSNINITWGGA